MAARVSPSSVEEGLGFESPEQRRGVRAHAPWASMCVEDAVAFEDVGGLQSHVEVRGHLPNS
jgi:hypothetical protein